MLYIRGGSLDLPAEALPVIIRSFGSFMGIKVMWSTTHRALSNLWVRCPAAQPLGFERRHKLFPHSG